MATANVNLGIEALLTYAATSTYKDNSSWTTEKEFKPAEWWQRLDSNQPHTDFQSAALPDELRRLWYPVKVTILGLTIISRVLYL